MYTPVSYYDSVTQGQANAQSSWLQCKVKLIFFIVNQLRIHKQVKKWILCKNTIKCLQVLENIIFQKSKNFPNTAWKHNFLFSTCKRSYE